MTYKSCQAALDIVRFGAEQSLLLCGISAHIITGTKRIHSITLAYGAQTALVDIFFIDDFLIRRVIRRVVRPVRAQLVIRADILVHAVAIFYAARRCSVFVEGRKTVADHKPAPAPVLHERHDLAVIFHILFILAGLGKAIHIAVIHIHVLTYFARPLVVYTRFKPLFRPIYLLAFRVHRLGICAVLRTRLVVAHYFVVSEDVLFIPVGDNRDIIGYGALLAAALPLYCPVLFIVPIQAVAVILFTQVNEYLYFGSLHPLAIAGNKLLHRVRDKAAEEGDVALIVAHGDYYRVVIHRRLRGEHHLVYVIGDFPVHTRFFA